MIDDDIARALRWCAVTKVEALTAYSGGSRSDVAYFLGLAVVHTYCGAERGLRLAVARVLLRRVGHGAHVLMDGPSPMERVAPACVAEIARGCPWTT